MKTASGSVQELNSLCTIEANIVKYIGSVESACYLVKGYDEIYRGFN